MGRSLKIQKTSPGSGNGGASVLVDAGFNNFGSLTDPVYNSAGTLSASDFLGVVGGAPVLSSPSTSYPEISPTVNIALPNGTGQGAATGRIIRQKGAHKFLVSSNTTVQDEGIVAGASYMIIATGSTNWTLFGAPTGYIAGTIFTATANGSNSGNGTCVLVGQCILTNSGSPAAGYMSVRFSVGDSVAVYASYLTNKWIRDWNGMTYANYSDSNAGNNNYSNEHFYPSNFFTDEGTVTWSGAEIINSANAQNGSLQLAQVTKITA